MYVILVKKPPALGVTTFIKPSSAVRIGGDLGFATLDKIAPCLFKIQQKINIFFIFGVRMVLPPINKGINIFFGTVT